MYKTGDLTKNIEKLQNELKSIKYPHKVADSKLLEGAPLTFLPILSHSCYNYSSHVAKYLNDNDYTLLFKSDKEFFDKLYNACIHLFNFKPAISSSQFFKDGQYVEAKVIFCLEVIKNVKQIHNNSVKKTYSNNASKANLFGKNNLTKPRNEEDFETRSEKNKIKVINHRNVDFEGYNFDTRLMASPKFNTQDDNDNIYDNDNDNNYNNYNNYKQQREYDDGEYIEQESDNMNNYEQYEQAGNNNSYGKRGSFVDPGDKRSPGTSGNSFSNTQREREKLDFNSVIEIINNLAVSVKDMTAKVEVFKNNVESRVSKLEADMTLVKNRLNMLENVKVRTSYDKNIVNSSMNDEHFFSFAIDDNRDDKAVKRDTEHSTFKQNSVAHVLQSINRVEHISGARVPHNSSSNVPSYIPKNDSDKISSTNSNNNSNNVSQT
jgi:hypothetical protein